MKIIKAAIIAFSTYSKIPMPQFAWEDEDMRYSMCFFPWVGAVIGVLLWGWFCLASALNIGRLSYVLVGAAIPLLVTGGFHLDGYMDTMDAFHSYQQRERKLEILKDAHVGAFAVLMLAAYGLLYLAGFAQITDSRTMRVFCCSFFLARCMSGLGVVSFRAAKSEGLLYHFASTAHRRAVKGALYLQMLLCGGVMCYLEWKSALLLLGAAVITFVYYRWRSDRELGGITGDTAGYFLCICECAMALAAGAACLL